MQIKFTRSGLPIAIGLWLGWLSWLRPLMLPDEGRYAGVAWDMFKSHTFAVPLMNGMPYFHKPPLYYWLAEIAFYFFGVNEWSARLPSLLGAWAALAAVYAFTLRYRDVRTARIAALILATLPFFYGGAQFANMDMLVAATITLATLSGAASVMEHRAGRPYKRLMLACGFFAALALLSKGLIGIVLPTLVLFAWIALLKSWKSLRVLTWPPAIAIFLLFGLPWFVVMQVRYPEFFNYFFIYQQFDRFSGTGFNNVQPFWFYIPVLLGATIPWTLWGRKLIEKDFWAEPKAREFRLLMGVWVIVVLVFFSLPTSKLLGYILPAIPPLAALLAEAVMYAAVLPSRNTRRFVRISFAVAASVCIAAVMLTAIYGKHSVKPLIARYAGTIATDDELITLRGYPFDLSFYARTKKPTWIIDTWNDPSFVRRDSWRKELLDAAELAPAIGRQVLVQPEQLRNRLCDLHPHAVWIWGQPDDAARYDVLRNAALLTKDREVGIWRLQIDDTFKAAFCVEAKN
jgi:4-amino-4-deoxy-L-arabinose transferase-like glycosyltransferase